MMGNADVIRLLNDGLAAARTLCETAESHDSLDQLRRTAHRVKGSTGTLGMTAVYRSAAEIEEAAIDGRMATSAMSRLRDEIAATRSALHASGFRV
jgi:HPt (histidine-containing phosphotransfer) domain-containing protein